MPFTRISPTQPTQPTQPLSVIPPWLLMSDEQHIWWKKKETVRGRAHKIIIYNDSGTLLTKVIDKMVDRPAKPEWSEKIQQFRRYFFSVRNM